MSFWAAFAVGTAAAIGAEFLPIHALRYTPKEDWPPWAGTVRYWVLSGVGCLIGGCFAGAYATGSEITWYIAANVGAAWPSILNGLARVIPAQRPAQHDVD